MLIKESNIPLPLSEKKMAKISGMASTSDHQYLVFFPFLYLYKISISCYCTFNIKQWYFHIFQFNTISFNVKRKKKKEEEEGWWCGMMARHSYIMSIRIVPCARFLSIVKTLLKIQDVKFWVYYLRRLSQ